MRSHKNTLFSLLFLLFAVGTATVSAQTDWKKIGETTDDGNWDAPAGDCGFPENTVVTEGGGVVFIRNTDVGKVEYTKLSWREISN